MPALDADPDQPALDQATQMCGGGGGMHVSPAGQLARGQRTPASQRCQHRRPGWITDQVGDR
jgi:hypothetical protein